MKRANQLLSVIVPMFNEERFIGELLIDLVENLSASGIEFEILVVDDGSTDDSVKNVRLVLDSRITLLKLSVNSGKGQAVKLGIQNSKGDFLLIQDADREYLPQDIPKLFDLASQKEKSVVYGSRYLGAQLYQDGLIKKIGLWKNQSIGPWLFNILLSRFYFLLTRIKVTDLMTGYKLYPKVVFVDWLPTTNGFETDHEITQRIRFLGLSILEVPILYHPRTKAEGKKIRFRDGIKAFSTILRFM